MSNESTANPRDNAGGITGFRVSSHVLFTSIDGQAVLMDKKNGTYLGLDDVGSCIWEGLAGGKSLAEVSDIILRQYDVHEKELEQDMQVFIEVLLVRGLIEAISQDGNG